MFAVIFICGNLFLRIARKPPQIAKSRTRKNSVPHGIWKAGSLRVARVGGWPCHPRQLFSQPFFGMSRNVGGNVAWHSKKRLPGRLLGFSGFFRRLSGCLCSPLRRYRVVNVSPLLSYALSNNPRIVYCTQPEDAHVNNIISLIMHWTVYLLPVFSFAKILQ